MADQEKPSQEAPGQPEKPAKPLKKGLLGYRRKQVDALLEERDSGFAELRRQLEYLSAVVRDRDAEIEGLQKDLAEAKRHSDEAMTSLATLGSQLEQMQSHARSDAERIRREAFKDVDEVGEKVSALVRIRDEMVEQLRAALDTAMAQVGGIQGGASAAEIVRRLGLETGQETLYLPGVPAGTTVEAPVRAPKPAVPAEPPAPEPPAVPRPPVAEPPPEPPPPAPEPPMPPPPPAEATTPTPAEPMPEPGVAAAPEPTPSEPEPEPAPSEPETEPAPPQPVAEAAEPPTVEEPTAEVPSAEAQVIQLDIGPLNDFAELARFEDALVEINAVLEVAIERFSEGRAKLMLRVDTPAEVLPELQRRAPLPFEVRTQTAEVLVLDVRRE